MNLELTEAVRVKNSKKVEEILLSSPEFLKHPEHQKTGSALLRQAIISGQEKVIELLVASGADPNLGNPLKAALSHASVQSADLLLKHGALLVGPQWAEKSPVECVFERKNRVKSREAFLGLLIGHGAVEVGAKNEKGQNLLHRFVDQHVKSHDHDAPKIAEVLIGLGVPVDEVDDDGWTPLMFAVKSKHKKLVSYLIRNRANVNQRDQRGNSALHLTADKNWFNATAGVDIVELLLSSGARINARNHVGRTALHLACLNYKYEIISLLLRKGADSVLLDSKGETPFSLLKVRYYDYNKCIKIMFKEYSRLSFENIPVPESDTRTIQDHRYYRDYFERCKHELDVMAIVKFYDSYSYYDVLRMAKGSMKKLSKLAKNKDFVEKFNTNLPDRNFLEYVCSRRSICLSYETIHKDELKKILDEAIRIKNRSLIVEARLKKLFGDFLVYDVIECLAEKLTVEDLPMN